MSKALAISQKSAAAANVMPVPGTISRRQCIRSQRSIGSNDCENKKGLLQRKSADESPIGEVPPIVHEVLHQPGQPLDSATRALAEPSFGHDFSQVRVHTNSKAAESARAVNALAYTVGRHVVFGAGHYPPTRGNRLKLLAHELTHVVQQGFALPEPGRPIEFAPSESRHEREAEHASMEEFPSETSRMQGVRPTQLLQQKSVASAPDPTHHLLTEDQKARIDSFLKAHQVVLLRGENRAWLDGQRVTIDSLVSRVRREAHVLLPDNDVIASYIDTQSFRTSLQLQLPPGVPQAQTLVPPGSLSTRPALGPNLVLEPHLLPEDRQRILTFLQTGGLAVGPGLQPIFGGLATTVDAVIERARSLVLPIIPREDVAVLVSAEWSRLLFQALTHVPLPPPPPITIPLPKPASAISGNAEDLQSAVGGQWAWHLNRTGGVERTVQVSLSRGPEAYQFGVNLDTGESQVLGGMQLQKETSPVDLFCGALKVKGSAFFQLLAGITTAGGAASGDLTFQVQAGVQVTVTFGPVTVSIQAAPSLTLQTGQGATVDFNVAPQAGQYDKETKGLPRGPFPPFQGIPIIQGRF